MFIEPNKRVAWEEMCQKTVLTIFLGIYYGRSFEKPLWLFETIVFVDDWHGEVQWRYSTWEEAEEGHKKIVDGLKRKKAVVTRA